MAPDPGFMAPDLGFMAPDPGTPISWFDPALLNEVYPIFEYPVRFRHGPHVDTFSVPGTAGAGGGEGCTQERGYLPMRPYGPRYDPDMAIWPQI